MTTSKQHVFTSYSTKDIYFVERLRASLHDASIPYWIDKEGLQPGTRNWEKAIRSAIQNSFVVILVASPNSVESDYVPDEIEITRNVYQRIVVPVWAHGDQWNACVPLGMGKMQYVDLRGDSFNTNFPRLLQAIDIQRGADRRTAESVFLSLDAEAQARFGHVFFHLFALDERDVPIRQPALLKTFPADESTGRLIRAFVEAKLFIERLIEGAVILELASDVLLRSWDRLTQWIRQVSDNKRLLQKLEVDAAYWAKRGKPRDRFRYSPEQEFEVEAISAQWEIAFSPLVQEFLHPQVLRWLEDAAKDGETMNDVALRELWSLPSTFAPMIISAMSTHPASSVRRLAIALLIDAKELRAIDYLIANLTDSDADLRLSATRALGSLGDLRALDPLIAALVDPDSSVRSNAAEALGGLGDPRAVDPLITALVDPDSSVRNNAAEALGGLGDPRALDPLVAALVGPDRNVRDSAARALGQLGDVRAVDPLIADLTDPYEDVRVWVAKALSNLGSQNAIEPLTTLLEDESKWVREAAQQAIEQLRAKSAKPVDEDIAEDKS